MHFRLVSVGRRTFRLVKAAPLLNIPRIYMSIEFNSIQRQTQVRRDSGCSDLDHVETCNVGAEAQTALNREYIKFLEAKNAHLKDLYADAFIMLSVAAFCLNRAQKLLERADKAPLVPTSTFPAPSNGS